MAETEQGRWPLQEVTAEAFEGRERTQATGGRRGKHGDSCSGKPVGEPLDRVDATGQVGDATAARDHD